MYIGHVGAALAGRWPRATVGMLALLVATYAPDWIDTALCFGGAYDTGEMLSHSIPAILFIAVAGFVAYALVTRDRAGAAVIAGVVVSHMVFDWITGWKPTWPGGPMIGLQLYSSPIADFVVEGAVITAGALIYARTLPLRRRPWLAPSIMLGALLALQLGIDGARLLVKSLPKC